MKKINFLLLPLIAAFISFGLVSCSDDDDNTAIVPDDPTLIEDYHFDLWVALDRHGGMGRDVQTLVRSINSLESDQPEITFTGTGTEVNATLTLETILKGAYYYQVPVSGDRFAKYTISNNQINVVAERRFATNTYTTRKYTHAWTDESTLVIMAANGAADKIVWTKLNADNMTIISEGTLDVKMPEGGALYTTSGILTYRASDNKLFYFYFAKADKRFGGQRVCPMKVAVINPATMAVESDTECFMDCEMVGTAYGELLQTTTFVDDNNNLYIVTITDEEDGERSHLLKIPAGSTAFDKNYDGYKAAGKLISVMYLGGDKVMSYVRNDQLGTQIDAFSHYYTVIDVKTCQAEPVKYNGQQLAYSGGRFSSRMAYVNHKAYIGVDAQNTNPVIYIYDALTGQTTKGAEMGSGYYFEQIRVVENVK